MCANSDCNAANTAQIGDGICDWDKDGYNTLGCNWDGGDCCYQTCVGEKCGDSGFVCLNPDYKTGERT